MQRAAVLASFVAAASLAAAPALGKVKPGPPPPKLKGALSATGQARLTDAKARTLTATKAGWYTVSIADNAKAYQFRLVGPGVNKSTGAKFRGVVLWGVHLKRGTYKVYSRPQRGSAQTFSVR
jgi:hypothetical protein